jgi:hypothetical protein
VGYEYRVFIDSAEGDTDAKHYTDEKLYQGAIFRVNKPEAELHGKAVLVYRVDSHPGFQSVGIAWARTKDH